MRPWAVGALALLGGCGPVTSAVHTREYRATPVPKTEVQVFLAGDSIPPDCVPVADLHASVEPKDLGLILAHLREAAGELGGTALQVRSMQRPGFLEDVAAVLVSVLGSYTEGYIDSDAVALHCPPVRG